MTVLSGLVAVSNPAITLNQWKVLAIRSIDGQLAGSAEVAAAMGGSAAYTILCGDAVGPCLLAVAPKIDAVWAGNQATSENALLVSDSNDTPFLFKAQAAPLVPEDPDWAFVVFRMELQNDFTDDKGHTINLSPTQPELMTNDPPRNDTGQPITGGYVYFSNVTTGWWIESSSADFNLGTGDFTIEMWVKPSYNSDWKYIFSIGDAKSANGLGVVYKYNLGFKLVSNNADVASFTGTYSTWQHLTLVRTAGVLAIYKNGDKIVDNIAFTTNLSGNIALGRNFGEANTQADSYLADFRVTKGLARYAASFSKPQALSLSVRASKTGSSTPDWDTRPGQDTVDDEVTWRCVGRAVQPIAEGWLIPSRSKPKTDGLAANVVFLLPLDSDALDVKNSPQYFRSTALELVSAPKPTTDGLGVGSFKEGTEGYYGVSFESDNFELGTGDFCIDGWFKAINPGSQWSTVIEVGDHTDAAGIGMRYRSNAGVLEFMNNSSPLISVAIPTLPSTADTDWHHFAVTRQGTDIKMFLDGTAVGTATLSTSLSALSAVTSKKSVFVGGDSRQYNNGFRGLMADLRVTKAARHWANFSLPTSRITEY